MKKTPSLIEKLQRLADGETLPSSSLRGDWIDQMLEEGVLLRIPRGRQTSYRVASPAYFRQFLADRYDIRDLQAVREALSGNASRAELVASTGDSKFVKNRSFSGFPVNCYEPLQVELHGETLTLQPYNGAFTFISDYDSFKIPADYIIIGIENAENFRLVDRQRAFFEQELGEHKFLFVSRYPQNGDLVSWLENIPNQYIHFGDLDLAGIHIFQSEFLPHLEGRASFLVPTDYDHRISQGSRERYNVQLPRYSNLRASSPQILLLLDSIHRHHRGYDQEGFIVKQ